MTAVGATADKITYSGALGKRDGSSGMDVKPDSIFRIASMSNPDFSERYARGCRVMVAPEMKTWTLQGFPRYCISSSST